MVRTQNQQIVLTTARMKILETTRNCNERNPSRNALLNSKKSERTASLLNDRAPIEVMKVEECLEERNRRSVVVTDLNALLLITAVIHARSQSETHLDIEMRIMQINQGGKLESRKIDTINLLSTLLHKLAVEKWKLSGPPLAGPPLAGPPPAGPTLESDDPSLEGQKNRKMFGRWKKSYEESLEDPPNVRQRKKCMGTSSLSTIRLQDAQVKETIMITSGQSMNEFWTHLYYFNFISLFDSFKKKQIMFGKIHLVIYSFLSTRCVKS